MFPIVGIGASAGGLEAYKQLLPHLPARSGMAFVLIQHLAPKHGSALVELLSRHTKIPIAEGQEGMAVASDHIYVISPNEDMSISHGRLHLVPRAAAPAHHMPIDYFLRSLAADRGARAIGVILSGTASDGTLGVKAIKAEGGITFAQDEESAKYPEMPRHAIAAGAVDYVLPPDKIALELVRIAGDPYVRLAKAPEISGLPPTTEAELKKVFTLLQARTGVNFDLYKHTTIKRRMRRRMLLHKIDKLRDYIQLLEATPPEIDALFQDILIHVTGFFRDPETFQALKKRVFPALVAKRDPRMPIRIWVPGCSTGEEVYSIAIALLEFLGDNESHFEVQFFATDISDAAVEKARAGIYLQNIAAEMSPERLRRFFSKADSGYRISKLIRDMCVFAKHDVTKDPPFSNLDLLSCRNLLIYLGPVLQKRVLPFFQYAVKPGGYLLLGSAENLGGSDDRFDQVDKKHKIYIRRPTPPRPLYEFGSSAGILTISPRGERRPEESPSGFDAQKEVDRLLLSKYVPAAVLVNENLEILQFRGRVAPFLEPTSGQASLTLPRMAKEGLLVDLRSAIHAARRDNTVVRREGIQVKSNGKSRSVNIEVVPLPGPTKGEHTFLVLFEETPAAPLPLKGRAKAFTESRVNAATKQEVTRLKSELGQTKASLQSIIEQQETSNEELRSANEEILSSNEELQSTNEELETAKEELQSTNEELSTLNEELQNRNVELSVANDDLNNLLNCVNIPIVMVGRDLRIRRFTPMAEKILNIIPTDIGRPIGNLRPNFEFHELEPLITESMDANSTREREVQDRDERWYSLRVHPYRTLDNRIEGAVLMILDIDVLKSEVYESRLYAESIVDIVQTQLIVLDGHLKVKVANPAFYKAFQVTREDTEGRFIYELGDGQWNIPKLRHLLEDILPERTEFNNFSVEHDFPRIGHKTMLLNGRAIRQKHAPGQLILLAIEDVTERFQIIQSLEKTQGMFRKLFEESPDAMVASTRDGKIARINFQVEKMFGYDREELVGKPIEILVPDRFKDVHPGHRQDYYGQPRVRPMGAELELHAKRKDGQEFPVEIMLSPLETEEGRLFMSVIRDVTDRKRAEEALKESQAQLHSILDSSPAIIFVKDTEGRYIYSNPGFQKLTRLRPKQILGKTDDELFAPQQAAAFRANDAQVLSGGHPLDFEEFATQEDGIHTSIVTKFPLHNTRGETYGICGIVTDITRRKRAEESLRLLLEVSAISSEAEDVASMTFECLKAICRLAGWQVGQAWYIDEAKNTLFCDRRAFSSEVDIREFRQTSLKNITPNTESLLKEVWKNLQPRWVIDVATEENFVRKAAALKSGLVSGVLFPICSGQHLYAIWEFYSTTRRQRDVQFLESVEKLGKHLAVAFERKRAEGNLRILSGKLLKSQDEERRRIARELHDSTAQTLAAAGMNLTALTKEAKGLGPRASELVSEATTLVDHAAREVRTMSYLLHPPALDQVGLAPALRWYVDGFTTRSGVQVEVNVPPELERLPEEVETAIFRIVQESLSNVHRHSQSPKATLRVKPESEKVTIEVIDEGTGLYGEDGTQLGREGVGVAGMRERVKELGGEFEIISGKGGTTVRAVFPIWEGRK